MFVLFNTAIQLKIKMVYLCPWVFNAVGTFLSNVKYIHVYKTHT